MRGAGLDETPWLRANARRHAAFVTGFVDIVGGRLLDIAGRSAAVVEGGLAARRMSSLEGVHTVAIDPHRGYANGIAEHLAKPPSWWIHFT